MAIIGYFGFGAFMFLCGWMSHRDWLRYGLIKPPPPLNPLGEE